MEVLKKKESADLSASQSAVFFSHTKSGLAISTFLLQQISIGYQPQPAEQVKNRRACIVLLSPGAFLLRRRDGYDLNKEDG